VTGALVELWLASDLMGDDDPADLVAAYDRAVHAATTEWPPWDAPTYSTYAELVMRALLRDARVLPVADVIRWLRRLAEPEHGHVDHQALLASCAEAAAWQDLADADRAALYAIQLAMLPDRLRTSE
jgi:hypothetical protein